ncbi:MAG: dimethylargininase, partial [Gemmatimonadaceae bacterium]
MIALTRPVSPTLADCELTHLERVVIDVERAAQQHAAYEALLESLGADIVRAAAAPDHPDAVFVEDTAIVLDEIAVITRPGAASRRGELDAVASLLSAYRVLLTLTDPATLDGGDVIRMGRTLYVGRSGRTNEAGIEQLRRLIAPHDYRVVPVDFAGCLHLKS